MSISQFIRDATAAGIYPKVLPKARHKVAFLGDSITAFAINDSASAKQWTNYGYVSWVRWACGQRFYTDHSLVLGVPSMGTAHLLATQVPNAIAARAQIAVVHIGINDVGALTLAQMISNTDAAFTALNNANILVVAVPIAPTNSNDTAGAAFSSAAKQQQIAAFNHWLWLQAQKYTRSVVFSDIRPAMVDYATGYALTAYLVDGLHDNVASCQVKGGVVAATLNALLPPQPPPFQMAYDTFDASLSPQGNLIGSSGLFIGTGGTTNNSGTGTVATSWQGGRDTSGGSTLSVAMSKVVDPAYSTLFNQVVTVGGTADGVHAVLERLSISTTGVTAGMYVYAEAEASWTGLANMNAITLYGSFLDGSSVLTEFSDGAMATGKGVMPAEGSAVFRTEPFLLPTGFSALRLRCRARSALSGTPAGAITWKRAALRIASRDGLSGL